VNESEALHATEILQLVPGATETLLRRRVRHHHTATARATSQEPRLPVLLAVVIPRLLYPHLLVLLVVHHNLQRIRVATILYWQHQLDRLDVDAVVTDMTLLATSPVRLHAVALRIGADEEVAVSTVAPHPEDLEVPLADPALGLDLHHSLRLSVDLVTPPQRPIPEPSASVITSRTWLRRCQVVRRRLTCMTRAR
jgi:hypothetical protein